MSAWLEAINFHLAELEARLERLVYTVLDDCCTKGIITDDICQSIHRSNSSKREKTKELISQVWNPIREDARKAELFIQILEQYFQDLVRKIRKDKEDIEDRTKVAQAKDTSKGTMLLPARKPRKRQAAKSTKPSQCTEKSTAENSTTVCTTEDLHLDPGAGGAHYNTMMELVQQEAKLNETLEQVKRLEEERDAIKEKRSALEIEFQLKDRKLDEVMVEKDALKCSNDILRLRLSKGEQKRYADKETVAKRISQDEERIRVLEREKEEAKAALETCDGGYMKLQQKVDSYDDKVKSSQATIDKLNADLIKLDNQLAEQENKPYNCICCHCRNILITMCVGLIIIAIMIVQAGAHVDHDWPINLT